MRLFILILTTLLLPHSQASESPNHGKPLFVSPPSIQITKTGHNRQAQFLSNENIIFISKDRKTHKDPQLYFKDLRKNKEKRITHQKGQITGGAVLNRKGKIIYSSSTDEEKETPLILKKYLDRFPSSVKNDNFFHLDFSPQEIYMSRIDGTDIKRLTEYQGYDGLPTYLEDKDRIYFSKWASNQLAIYAKSLSKDLEPWKLSKTNGHDLGLQLSPSESQFVWSRFSPDFKTSQLLLSGINLKNPKFLTLESGVNWSPIWHPDGKSVIYSARSANMNSFDLFEISHDGNCQRQLTSYAGDEFFPAVSPNGKKLMFTSTQSGHEQIHQMNYPGPMDCSTK